MVVAVRDHVSERLLNEKMTELSEKFHGTFLSLNTMNIDVSSEMIRSWIREGRSIRYYVPDDVIQYIYKNKVYLGENTADGKI